MNFWEICDQSLEDWRSNDDRGILNFRNLKIESALIFFKVAKERARLLDLKIKKSQSTRLESEKSEKTDKDVWIPENSHSDFSLFEKAWNRIENAMKKLKFTEEKIAEVSRLAFFINF